MTAAQVLMQYMEKIRQKNPAFSLRAFSKKVGISPGRMSELMAGKRQMTFYYADRISDGLKLTDAEREELRAFSNVRGRKLANSRVLRDQEVEMLSSWEYYAILNVLNLNGIKKTSENIARRLGLPLDKTIERLKTLQRTGYIEWNAESGAYKRIVRGLDTEVDVPSSALRQFQSQHIMKSLEVMHQVPVQLRDYSTITMSINPKKLDKAKKAIARFQDRISILLEDGDRTEVYDLTIQLFPLTVPQGQ